MKKFSTIFISLTLVISLCLFGCDCETFAYKEITAKKETDGLFYYFYDKKIDGYAIIGDLEEKNPEVMYIPPYYKGKEVKYVYYNASGGLMSTTTFGPSFINVRKVYIPFNSPSYCSIYDNSDINLQVNVEEIYNSGEIIKLGGYDLYKFFLSEYIKSDKFTMFFSVNDYYKIVNQFNQALNEENSIYELQNSLIDKTTYYDSLFERYMTFQKANITYLFNYENSPNGGVFFIDNCGYGESIKNPPYDPIREDYTFEGWYKESECINKWNFETDTLPIVEYDKDGNPVEFIETKLYAKWQKN